MPHARKRHILEPFQKLLGHARIVGVLGHRQVGKSTFIETHSKEYVTLDAAQSLRAAQADPEAFLEQLKGNHSAIDECQLVPALFPALKLRVGTTTRPGQFILSGSVRFSSRKAIRESLTGRISNLELYPMVLTELENERNSDFIIRFFRTAELGDFLRSLTIGASLHAARSKRIDQYFEKGGLPGICFIREALTRVTLTRDLIGTILDRDLRLIYPTSVSFSQLQGFARFIAEDPSLPHHLTHAKQEVGLAPATQRKILSAMESVFLIRSIPIRGDQKGNLYWFEDQTERWVLSGRSPYDSPWDWIGLVFRNLRAQFGYRLGIIPMYYCYRTRGGAEVPLVIEVDGKQVGIFCVSTLDEFSRSMHASADSLIRRYPDARILILTRKNREISVITSRIAAVPLSIALFD